MLLELGGQPFPARLRVVLRGDQHGVDAQRLVVLVVFDGHLGLAVRTQVRHFAGLAHFGQAEGQTVGQIDRQRHQHVGLVGGVTEHHALVAGALGLVPLLAAGLGLLLAGEARHTLIDLGALAGDGDDHAAGVGVETDLRRRVADAAQRLAHGGLDVDIPL